MSRSGVDGAARRHRPTLSERGSCNVHRSVPLYIARHGETVDNARGLILGRRDPPLSGVGREQSAQLAAQAAALEVVALWCSPLLRARQTAAVVADAIAIEPTILDNLIESARGTWECQSVARIAEATPALHAAFEAADTDFAFPGGESLLEQGQRTRKALNLVASGPGPALVVAHAGNDPCCVDRHRSRRAARASGSSRRSDSAGVGCRLGARCSRERT